MKRNQLSLIFAILILACIIACKSSTEKKSIVLRDTLLKGNFAAETGIIFDSLALDSFINNRPILKPFESDFRKLYQNANYNFVWFDQKGLIEPATTLIEQVNDALQNHLLDSASYLSETKVALESLQTNHRKSLPNLKAELLLTAQYFIYAKNMWEGITPDDPKATQWYIPRKKLSFVKLLESTVKDNEFEDTSVVVAPYMDLKKALNHFVEWRKKTGDDMLIKYHDSLRKIRVGDSVAAIAEIRKRLYQLSDLKEDNGSQKYDSLLLKAIKQYQNRVGVTVSSSISKSLVNSLNITTAKRVETILINLERMRWMPASQHPKEYIVVNIPEFKLHYFVNDTINWNCNVVVGKTLTKTVIFRGMMKHVVFSPYWYVPESIINKEIKPAMAKNPNYLANHRMEWNGGQVRQKPGISNSLGLVKFIFPNSNSIYLHDTPSKSLFSETDRAFSHGCVRVAKPVDLAMKVLAGNGGWDEAKVLKAMNAGKENTVLLKQQIPVNIVYFTAFVGENGLLNFRNDIYERDTRMASLLIASR